MENQDVDRTLTLLWRRTLGTPQGSRGPKQRVSVDEVIRAGIEVADAEGLPAFSMRKVADRLGLKLMSIYTYVPGKNELIGLMVDEVMGEQPLPPHAGTLRERMTAIADLLWDEFHRHPWLLQVESSRPWIGPHGSDRYEWQLAAIEGAGFTDLEMDQVVTLLDGFAAAAARASVLARRTAEQSGITDAEWWSVNAPVLERVMPAGAYPLSGRVGQVAGEEYNAIGDPRRSYRFGLERILDGLERLLDR
ncbi:TetR/AcrR family transcriptional regulator C-terminal domain-containing protein [Jidongwangia harbinensis]|uniref:TetR/AcrR family transcriptional regulator C-terminal domain-containing protein n=1 Tax=Jidongwangia harbinensis TaxID=2878561 RepID=UPI001CDA491D|nr:TetR/AcrR family transcriptional regulator C-terminal domain-containing protein [Jidongwangia harbinensis]MCA2215277.1 TetR/AcrR family transcriptional regulator [Jidongwangia harbinensis]